MVEASHLFFELRHLVLGGLALALDGRQRATQTHTFRFVLIQSKIRRINIGCASMRYQYKTIQLNGDAQKSVTFT